MQNDEGMNPVTAEKDPSLQKEAQRKKRIYKQRQDDYLKSKKEFDEVMPAIAEKQKMYIENAKKAAATKQGRAKKGAGVPR